MRTTLPKRYEAGQDGGLVSEIVLWIDDHCHLGWGVAGPTASGTPDLSDPGGAAELEGVLTEARAAGVARMVTVGTNGATSSLAVAISRQHPGTVWATIGLHPHDASQGLDEVGALLHEAAASPAVVAVGECGLDYHYDHSPRAAQREVFAAQVALAHELSLALVIHTREAWDDTFAILDAEGVPDRTVLHCFTGGPAEARGCLDRGMYLSFSGIITFRGAQDIREAAQVCPLDRVLVETDSPYLAPMPHRGKANSPAWLPVVGEAVADTKGVSPKDVAAATWRNAARAYGLPEQ